MNMLNTDLPDLPPVWAVLAILFLCLLWARASIMLALKQQECRHLEEELDELQEELADYDGETTVAEHRFGRFRVLVIEDSDEDETTEGEEVELEHRDHRGGAGYVVTRTGWRV
jgi:hypothetical protein